MPTNLYRLSSEGTRDYEIVGDRSFYLPGIHCSVCNVYWAELGVGYPSVDLGAIAGAEHEFHAANVTVPEFHTKAALPRPSVPTALPLLPGASFGPFDGKHTGRELDFMWCIGEV